MDLKIGYRALFERGKFKTSKNPQKAVFPEKMQIFFILVPLACPPFTILKLYNFSVCAVLLINTLLQEWFLTLTRCRSTKRYNKGSTKIIYLRTIRGPFSGGMERLATIIERGHFPISCEFFEIFNDIFFAERLRMTSPSDSL